MNNRYGLLIMGKYPEESVPLEKLEVYANFVNNFADVVCKFSYKNTSSDLLDSQFVFPLDANGAIYELEAVIGTKKLFAKCRERVEAEATYEEAVEKGHTAFMMQEDYAMGDTFRMKLGNIPPNESVLLTFKYVTGLHLREVDAKLPRFKGLKNAMINCFTMPAAIGERYDPNPNREGSFETKAGKLAGKMKFTADIYTDGRLISVTSALDKFSVDFKDETRKSAKVSLDGEFDFSHDFELELAFEDPCVLAAACEPGQIGEEGFLGMHCVVASFLPNVGEGLTSDGDKFEITFLIDRSGSMSGSRMKKAKEALLLFLKSLPTKCRFQIVGFGNNHEKLFPEPVDYTKDNLKTALAYQAEMEANMGGTEVLRALESVYDTPLTGDGWYRQIIFLTDGDVCNQNEVIGLVKRKQAEARLFAVGLGNEVSTSLLWGLARAGRGSATFVRDDENLRTATMSVLKASLQPIATDVCLTWDIECEGRKVDVCTVPSCVPPLIAGNYLTAFGLIPGGWSGGDAKIDGSKLQGKLTLSFTFHGKQHSIVSQIVQSMATECSNRGLHRIAAKSQLLELLDQHSSVRAHGKPGDDDRREKLRREIVSISTSANVIAPFTTFIGVDPDLPAQRSRPVPLLLVEEAPIEMCAPELVDCSAYQASDVLCSGDEGTPIGTQKSTPTTIDNVLRAAELQDFDGHWNLDEKVASLLGMRLAEMKSSKPTNVTNEKAWATALVVVFLQTRSADQVEEWEMMVEKALNWLQGGAWGQALGLLEAAKNALPTAT